MTRKKMFNVHGKRRSRHTAKIVEAGVSLRMLAADGSFPFIFFLRNMDELEKEGWWKRLSPRVQRLRLRTMLEERISIVREVKKWSLRHRESSSMPASSEPLEDAGELAEIAGYCTHCGMCCETASGLPDFPPQTQIPEQWQNLFGDGLGKGHRFCPFLWESKTPRGSVCAIHPWRSYPCRIFEREDCEFVRQDPDFKDLADRRGELMKARRRLFHLVNAG